MDEELFVLYDDEGKEESFAYLATIERDGSVYLALTPALEEEPEEDEDTEVVFMHVTEDPDHPGEDLLVIVEEEDLLDSLFEELMQMIEEED